jgi:hypothetical protein
MSLATRNLAFPALYKDGSLLLSGSGGMINGDNSSKLYALPAGTPVAGVTGLPANLQASLPAFSPDGMHVSFNFWGGTLPSGTTTLMSDQISLGIFDFDGNATFSNPRVLFTPANSTGGQPAVTYSSFFPNSAGIVFEVELHEANGWGYTWMGNTGELWWADVASGMAHRLDQLNGYGATGNIYLPDNAGGAATHTAAQDVTLNYEPTVNPIASGGYAWVVFTSRRMYGNVAQLAPWVSDPRNYAWRDQITDKKLWVAAVDLNATPGQDPSHPAFYLPAQELHAGNSRGYWSVEACRAAAIASREQTAVWSVRRKCHRVRASTRNARPPATAAAPHRALRASTASAVSRSRHRSRPRRRARAASPQGRLRDVPALASHWLTTAEGIVWAKSKSVAPRRRSAMERLGASKITMNVAVSSTGRWKYEVPPFVTPWKE